jgi:enoyl-CoA hydratase/carnithine racemase
VSEPSVLIDQGDGVGRIVLNRPAAMNAITVDLGRALGAAINGLAREPDVRVILIRGAGGNFCAGGDFREVERLRAEGPGALQPLFDNFAEACDSIARVEIPVVAAVEGYAMAGGFELTLASDIALVRDDAVLADNHVTFGQLPGGGSSQRLPRLVGRQRALGLILSGGRLSGRDAAAWGLAFRSFPAADFDVGVAAFTATLAGRSRAAVAGIKRLVYAGLAAPLAEGLALERRAVVDFIAGDAGAAGVAQFNTRGERP